MGHGGCCGVPRAADAACKLRSAGDMRAMPHAGGSQVEQHSPLEASMQQLEVHEPLLKHPPEDAGEHG